MSGKTGGKNTSIKQRLGGLFSFGKGRSESPKEGPAASGSLFSGLNFSSKVSNEPESTPDEPIATVSDETEGFSFITPPENVEEHEETPNDNDASSSASAALSSTSGDHHFQSDVTSSPVVVAQPAAATQAKSKRRRAVRPGHARIAEAAPSESFALDKTGEERSEIENRDESASQQNEKPLVVIVDAIEKRLEDEEIVGKDPALEVETIDVETKDDETKEHAESSLFSTPLKDNDDDDKVTESPEKENRAESSDKEGIVAEDISPSETSDLAVPSETLPKEPQVSSALVTIEDIPSENSASLLSTFSSRLESIRNDVRSAELTLKQDIEEKKLFLKKRLQKRHEVKRLLARQALAVEEENYEAADELNSSLETLQTEISEMSLHQDGGSDMRKSVEQRQFAVQREIELRGKLMLDLERVKEKEVKEKDQLVKESRRRTEREREKIDNMTEKFERHRSHIEMDKVDLKKSEDLLETELEERTLQFATNRKHLVSVRDSVKAEIAEVEARLTLLRSQENELENSILSVEKSIAAVEEEMSEEKSKLSSQKKQIEQQQLDLDAETYELERAQEAFEEKVKENEAAAERLSAEIASVDECVELSQREVEKLKEDDIALDEFVQSQLSLSADGDIQKLYDDERRLRTEVEMTASELLQKQNSAVKLKKRLKEINDLLPEMTTRKKLAAASRNFKEAGRLAKEAASMGEECEILEKDLSALDDDLKVCERELETKQNEHEECKANVAKQEREHELILIENARSTAASLREKILRLSEDDTRQKSTLYLLMQAEISWCESVIEELSFKHDFAASCSSKSASDSDQETEVKDD
ncbi:uncharacterized protein [Oscarella lobularis]|uniref:uncharacterized protein isoform X2 n=1 Tax=Oscarella lobularis TaxID=121494 RepID=UPI0033139677